ncbi:MAG TPA: glycosyltransferase [Pyrinomonadaceae bacterium]|jgi:glycosyltransferase involved in cell wall biosynthesis|nr:glycosyltransferase [Pyrinomonadaceae bacterium]
MPESISKLLIVSAAVHYRHEGRLYAYGPYVREIDIWADLFEQVKVAAPCRLEQPPGDCLPFARSNIDVLEQLETGGDDLRAKLKQILALPWLMWGLMKAMRGAEAIHVRCPGNLGLLGIMLAPLFSRHLVAKYAGQWTGYPGEPLTVGWQRALLRSRWWRGPVTVYGDWPDQPAHIVPFFTSILTDDQLVRARTSARNKKFSGPARVLYVGRLYEGKNVEVLIAALGELKRQGITLCCDLVGDGPLRHALEAQVDALGLRNDVRFVGAVEFEQVLKAYEQSDILVLASENEGWPKSLAEAMAFGLVCIGSDRGLMPWMLGEGRGIVVAPGDASALAHALRNVAGSGAACREMSERAAPWAQSYSLEGLREALRELFAAHWKVSVSDAGRTEEARRGGLKEIRIAE